MAQSRWAYDPNKPMRYMADVFPGFVFQPDARCLLEHFLVPRALHGRVPDHVIQDAVTEGVDVYAVPPEALPFPPCNRPKDDEDGKSWGYFFATRPAAAAGSHMGDREDVREVAAGGHWCSYGGEKEYLDDGGGVIAFRRRFAFYEEEADGCTLTPWRMKELRVNEAAPAFRGVAFHASAKDLVVLKVYYEVEMPEEEEEPWWSTTAATTTITTRLKRRKSKWGS